MSATSFVMLTFALGAVPELVPPAPPAPPPTAADVRASVERGLPYIEKAGQAWLKERKCIACHHGAFMLWSHNEARQRGFAIDAKKMDEWTAQVLTVYLNDRANFEKNKGGQVESTGVLLAQLGYAPTDDRTTEMLRDARNFILKAQKPDGSWNYAGQGQDRPAAEANETTTMWAFVALSSLKDDDEALKTSRDLARAWLEKNKTGEGNEALVLRFVLEQKFGAAERAKALLNELISRQNADGGWSWSKKRDSDPFATGQSLYALGLAGRGGDDPAVQKAWKYLVRSQRPDGSWFAPTKKASGGNDISSYWGTTWAVMGMIKTLPVKPE
jgi:hypothetical protein